MDAAAQAIAIATVDDHARAASWSWWLQYTTIARKDPYMVGYTTLVMRELLLAFAARVRTGVFGRKKQVGHQVVEKALRHVAQEIVLVGFQDPRRTYGAKELDLPFRHLLKSFKDSDPAPKPQLALPVETIEAAAAVAQVPTVAPYARAVADLVVIAFFFSSGLESIRCLQRTVVLGPSNFAAKMYGFGKTDRSFLTHPLFNSCPRLTW